MTGARPDYPTPSVDADNRPLLDGWQKGKLLLQHCGGCGLAFFYPRPMCPGCWSTELRWREAAGRGVVVSFSRIHRPNHPSFLDEVPIILAEIRLDEGAIMLARIITPAPDAIRTGLRIRLLAEGERYPLPTFAPE